MMIRLGCTSRSAVAVAAMAWASACAGQGRPGFDEDSAPEQGSIGESCACSADGRGVVCNGEVRPCGEGLYCLEDKCLEPCAAAKDAMTSVGCEYYSVLPDTFRGHDDAPSTRRLCHVAFVVNTWREPVVLDVDYAGTKYDTTQIARLPNGSGQNLTYEPLPEGKLPPGSVALLFLAGGLPGACPVPPAMRAEPELYDTGVYSAFHIVASGPVVAYDIYPYYAPKAFVSSATLLLPTSSWGRNYVGVSPFPPNREQAGNANFFGWVDVVAAEDDTTVRIRPSADVVGGGPLGPSLAGHVQTVHLARGRSLHMVQGGDLTGSVIESDKPVAMFSGARCIQPEGPAACDAAHQQIGSVRTLGSEYVAVGHKDRTPGVAERVPWRAVGMVSGTKLTYEPAKPPDAPDALEVGQGVVLHSTEPFVIRSQDAAHPFYFSGHMVGGASIEEGPHAGEGDPEFVNVVPTAQYGKDFTFFTDPTYPETSLVVVRKRGAGGGLPVRLDCRGDLEGWRPVGPSYEWTHVTLVEKDFAGVGGCDNGAHHIASDGELAVTVWGWGNKMTQTQWVSYAYPAGTRVAPINDVTIR